MSKKILIVEDEILLSDLLKMNLKEAGFEVETAYDGKEGLEKAKSFLPDLILLDLIMPVLDGYQVLQEMQKDPVLEKIPVIVLSNLGQEEEIAKAKRLGAKDFIIKANLDISELKHIIENFFLSKS
jgi:DNA-binding response OmpR family regulator